MPSSVSIRVKIVEGLSSVDEEALDTWDCEEQSRFEKEEFMAWLLVSTLGCDRKRRLSKC
jgi:hypothetical protein